MEWTLELAQNKGILFCVVMFLGEEEYFGKYMLLYACGKYLAGYVSSVIAWGDRELGQRHQIGANKSKKIRDYHIQIFLV